MSSDSMVLRSAIELMHIPSRARVLRSEALPDGVAFLLLVAAGDAEAESAAAAITDRPKDLIRKAAGFYIEQILLDAHCDSYRMLGANPTATSSELRRNMALLLRWLHPDVCPSGERSVLASKVTLAWDNLKTLERRAAYDELQRASLAKKTARHRQGRASTLKPRSGKLSKNGHRRMGAQRHGSVPTIYDVENMGFLRRVWLAIFGGARL